VHSKARGMKILHYLFTFPVISKDKKVSLHLFKEKNIVFSQT